MRIFIIIAVLLAFMSGLKFQLQPNIESTLTELRDEYAEYVSHISEENEDASITSWEAFKTKAEEMARQADIPPSVLIGMAALESGRGSSYLARTRNNYFGINAVDWNPSLAFSFDSPLDSINYYIKLIKSPLYKRAYAVRHDPYKMIAEIRAAGYATDPNYVGKVTSMSEFQEYLVD